MEEGSDQEIGAFFSWGEGKEFAFEKKIANENK